MTVSQIRDRFENPNVFAVHEVDRAPAVARTRRLRSCRSAAALDRAPFIPSVMMIGGTPA